MHIAKVELDKLVTQLENERQNSMYHFGIPGMRWGRRKVRPESNSSEDHKRKVMLKNKKLHEMSNTEIKAFNERRQLEKQFKELSKTEKSAVQKMISELLLNVGKQTANAYLSKYATKFMEDITGGDVNKTIKNAAKVKIKKPRTIGFGQN